MWDAISELKFREEDIHFSRKMGYTHDASGYVHDAKWEWDSHSESTSREESDFKITNRYPPLKNWPKWQPGSQILQGQSTSPVEKV